MENNGNKNKTKKNKFLGLNVAIGILTLTGCAGTIAFGTLWCSSRNNPSTPIGEEISVTLSNDSTQGVTIDYEQAYKNDELTIRVNVPIVNNDKENYLWQRNLTTLKVDGKDVAIRPQWLNNPEDIITLPKSVVTGDVEIKIIAEKALYFNSELKSDGNLEKGELEANYFIDPYESTDEMDESTAMAKWLDDMHNNPNILASDSVIEWSDPVNYKQYFCYDYAFATGDTVYSNGEALFNCGVYSVDKSPQENFYRATGITKITMKYDVNIEGEDYDGNEIDFDISLSKTRIFEYKDLPLCPVYDSGSQWELDIDTFRDSYSSTDPKWLISSHCYSNVLINDNINDWEKTVNVDYAQDYDISWTGDVTQLAIFYYDIQGLEVGASSYFLVKPTI